MIALILALLPLASILYFQPFSPELTGGTRQNEEEHKIFIPLAGKNTWPALCYASGTENYRPSTPEIPEKTLQQGTTITVTTNADIINGDVSSVAGLLANSGPDGIALREAIEATNNNPGEYTIRFSAQLDGATIYTGGTNNQDLPPLLGGSLIIDGDIDGDLTPDITLANASAFEFPFGSKIRSSNNTLHALRLEGYFIIVFLEPQTANTTYHDITISHLVMRDVLDGINLNAKMGDDTQATNNHWENILAFNNDLAVKQNGIVLTLNKTFGDHLDNVTISNNHIINPRVGNGCKYPSVIVPTVISIRS
jgi:hypothetical protein